MGLLAGMADMVRATSSEKQRTIFLILGCVERGEGNESKCRLFFEGVYGSGYYQPDYGNGTGTFNDVG